MQDLRYHYYRGYYWTDGNGFISKNVSKGWLSTDLHLTEHKMFLTQRFLSQNVSCQKPFPVKKNVSWHNIFPVDKRFLSQTFPVTNGSCHKRFLSQTFPVTKRFLTQNVSCHKTFPVTKRFSKNVSSTKSLMTQNVSSTKCSLLLKDVSCYKMFTFINVSNLCLFV